MYDGRVGDESFLFSPAGEDGGLGRKEELLLGDEVLISWISCTALVLGDR